MSLPPKGSFNSFIYSTSPTVPSLSPSSNPLPALSPKFRNISNIHLPKLSQSPVKRRLDDESLAKNQYIIRLTNDHSILRSIVAADKAETALRDDSSLHRSFKRTSAAIKLISKGKEDKALEFQHFTDNLFDIKEKRLRDRCKSLDAAANKVWAEASAMWINKKGARVSLNNARNFRKFLKELFDALDEDKNNVLTVDEFVIPLLSYGITTDPLYMEKALSLLLHTRHLSSVRIEKEQFLQLFQEDSRTDTILESLQHHTKSVLERAEETRLARRKTLGMVQRTETKIEDVVPRIYCTIEELVGTIKNWWSELLASAGKYLKYPSDRIHHSALSEFLAQKRLVSNNIEAMRLSNLLQKKNCIFFEQFESIFLKAILKSALMNLAVGLNSGEFAGKDSSLIMKLAKCQRKLMISGLSLRNTELCNQGKKALVAVEKYQNSHESGNRVRIMAKVKKEIEENKEDADQRVTNFLYKIDEHAGEFVDEDGKISTELRNPWDIRNHVNRLEKKIESMQDPEETFNKELYFSMLKPVEVVKHEFKNLPRKVRLFREKHLLECFLKASKKNEMHRDYNNQSI